MMRRSAKSALLCLTVAGLATVSSVAYAEDPTTLSPEEPLRAGEGQVIELTTPTVDQGQVTRVDQGSDSVKASLNANVAFDKDKAVLKPLALKRLGDVVEQLKSQPPGAITIKGYTDDLGSAEHGLTLSKQRAEAVRAVLAPQLPGFTLTAEGLGEEGPIAPNDTEANRAKNRRVEITYTRPAEQKPSATPSSAAPTRSVDDGSLDKSAGTLDATRAAGEKYTVVVHPVVVSQGLASLTLTLFMTADAQASAHVGPSFLTAEDDIQASKNAGDPSGRELIGEESKIRFGPSTNGRRINACFPAAQHVMLRTQTKKIDITCWYAEPRSNTVSVKVGTAGTVKQVPVLR